MCWLIWFDGFDIMLVGWFFFFFNFVGCEVIYIDFIVWEYFWNNVFVKVMVGLVIFSIFM